MPFPLTLNQQIFSDPPQLINAVVEQAKAGQQPARWLIQSTASRELPRETAIALCAALLQISEAHVLAEGLSLAKALADPPLTALLLLLYPALDAALLLSLNPNHLGDAIEDLYLSTLFDLIDPSDAKQRGFLLPLLRRAGHHERELSLVVQWGDTDEIQQAAVGLISGGLPQTAEAVFNKGFTRPDPLPSVIRAAFQLT